MTPRSWTSIVYSLLLSALFIFSQHAWADVTLAISSQAVTSQSAGTVTVTVSGTTKSVRYGQFSSNASVASGLAASFSADCNSPVWAKADGNGVITFRSKNGAAISAVDTQVTPDAGSSGTYLATAQIANPTSITLSCTPNSTVASGTIACTALLSGGATGGVSFTIGANTFASTTSDASGTAVATYIPGSLGPGTYSIRAHYQGSNTFQATVSAPSTVTVINSPALNASIYEYSVIKSDGTTSGYADDGSIVAFNDTVNGRWSMEDGYDSLKRLVSASQTPVTGPAKFYCWNYDNFGNRKTQTTSDNAFYTLQSCIPQGNANASQVTATLDPAGNNRVTSVADGSGASGIAFQYDEAGNLSDDGKYHYLYDAESRLCAVRKYVTGEQVGYIYDSTGDRVAKGTLTGALTCDLASNGFVLSREYLRGPGGEDLSDFDAQGNWLSTNAFSNGSLVATYNPQGVHFQWQDWLGSRRVQTDPFGNNETSCGTGPFGDSQACVGSGQDATPVHFTGKERDDESGLDNFGARMYRSETARWMTPDPGWMMQTDLGNPQTLNQYAYVLNDPFNAVDPDGLAARSGCNAVPGMDGNTDSLCDSAESADEDSKASSMAADQWTLDNYQHSKPPKKPKTKRTPDPNLDMDMLTEWFYNRVMGASLPSWARVLQNAEPYYNRAKKYFGYGKKAAQAWSEMSEAAQWDRVARTAEQALFRDTMGSNSDGDADLDKAVMDWANAEAQYSRVHATRHLSDFFGEGILAYIQNSMHGTVIQENRILADQMRDRWFEARRRNEANLIRQAQRGW